MTPEDAFGRACGLKADGTAKAAPFKFVAHDVAASLMWGPLRPSTGRRR
jgi:hypothetical protein